MSRHKHAELMAQYAADAMTTDKPWVLWQFKRPCSDEWLGCGNSPTWYTDHEFRRKPKQHTIVLTTAQLKEVIIACDYPSWENEDFLSAEQILINALNGEQA
jgi:hypothetical protein